MKKACDFSYLFLSFVLTNTVAISILWGCPIPTESSAVPQCAIIFCFFFFLQFYITYYIIIIIQFSNSESQCIETN